MNRIRILAAALSLTAGHAFAEQPFVTKQNHSGYTMVEWGRSEKCELFANRVVITKGYGGTHSITEVRRVSLLGDMASLIARASQETEEIKPNLLCDGPSTLVEAHSLRGSTTFTLFATGGCGSPSRERTGGSSRILRDMIDDFCKTTHDFTE